MKRIYLSGPITKPDPFSNLLNAIKVGDELIDLGLAPIIPHLSFFQQRLGKARVKSDYDSGYELWMKIDFAFLEACHALYRIPGFSLGADREVGWAKERFEIPVFYSLDEVRKWVKGR